MNELTEESLGFVSSADRLEDEKKTRISIREKRLKLGIKFLDAIFGGVLPYDLVLIGAKTGSGKTELITEIAYQNSLAGKNVYFFSLEAEPYEIERRIKFKAIAKAYYQRGGTENLNYPDWLEGYYDEPLKDLEPQVDAKLKEELKRLKTFYRGAGFTIGDFERLMSVIQNNADLILCDHIHYFDLETQDANRELGEITKKINDLVKIYGIPVVLVGHLRKLSRTGERILVPALEDFHGTSDLGKQVTKAVVIAKGEPYKDDPNFSETYFRIAKYRGFGAAEGYVGRLLFNTKNNTYLSTFAIGRLSQDETRYIEIAPDKYPNWLKLRISRV